MVELDWMRENHLYSEPWKKHNSWENQEVILVPKIPLSKDRENNIREYFVDEEMVDVKYPNNLDEFDDLLDHF